MRRSFQSIWRWAKYGAQDVPSMPQTLKLAYSRPRTTKKTATKHAVYAQLSLHQESSPEISPCSARITLCRECEVSGTTVHRGNCDLAHKVYD